MQQKTILVTDASSVAIAAVLVQQDKWGSQISFLIQAEAFSGRVKRFSTTEKEALAGVWACKRFKLYLYGIDCDPVRDYKPKSKPNARIERWIMRSMPYKFKVRYFPGKEIVDPLSKLSSQK